jgi:hypothetical protein
MLYYVEFIVTIFFFFYLFPIKTVHCVYTFLSNCATVRWPRGQCARRTIAEANQHWLVIVWVTKNVKSRAPPNDVATNKSKNLRVRGHKP